MSDDIPENPALARLLNLPPAALEEISENPDALSQLSRVQLALVQEKLTRQYLDNPEASVAQGTAVHEALRKVSNLEGANAKPTGGAGPSVVFNFNVAKPPAVTVTDDNTVTIDAA